MIINKTPSTNSSFYITLYAVSSQSSTNFALNQPASQSSNDGATRIADNAVDGIQCVREPEFPCANTQTESSPAWWYVDLGESQTVREVWITNREACEGDCGK